MDIKLLTDVIGNIWHCVNLNERNMRENDNIFCWIKFKFIYKIGLKFKIDDNN